MRFERDMIAPIRQHLLSRWRDALAIEEFGVGYGVADLVATRPNHAAVARRKKLGQWASASHRDEARVLCALRTGPKAVAELAQTTGIPLRRLRSNTLRFLLAQGFTCPETLGVVGLIDDYRPVVREIWAVEAKLKNWYQGLCQARRYQHFAHRVFLAVPDDRRSVVKNDLLRRLNVGLIAVTSSSARIILRPRRATPRSEDLHLMSMERIWGVTQSQSMPAGVSRPRERPQATS